MAKDDSWLICIVFSKAWLIFFSLPRALFRNYLIFYCVEIMLCSRFQVFSGRKGVFINFVPPLVTYLYTLYTNSCLGPPRLSNGCCRIEILPLPKHMSGDVLDSPSVEQEIILLGGQVREKWEVLRNLNFFLQPLAKNPESNPPPQSINTWKKNKIFRY